LDGGPAAADATRPPGGGSADRPVAASPAQAAPATASEAAAEGRRRNSSSWFQGVIKSAVDWIPKPKTIPSANLKDGSKFYYDEAKGRWISETDGDQGEPVAPPPPPMTAALGGPVSSGAGTVPAGAPDSVPGGAGADGNALRAVSLRGA